MRHLWHKAIVWYLRRCAGAFHAYPYGTDGRYVVLMTDDGFHAHRNAEAKIERLQDALYAAECETVIGLPDRRELCYICAHFGPAGAIEHRPDCPFALLKCG